MARFEVKEPLILEEVANLRYATLSANEAKNRGYRVIGGDRGDLCFTGYDVDRSEGTTTLENVSVRTKIEGLNDDELYDLAREILSEAYCSVGIECIYHS